jgi:hypothetical protein
MKKIVLPFLILLSLLTCTVSFSQKAVLVKLNTQKNRISYFEKRGDIENADHLKKDAAGVMKATIGDFQENFHYCVVYYFMDTVLDRVLASDMNGILLDKDLKPVTDPVVKNGDANFLIVYYGIPDDVETDNRDGTIYRSGNYPDDGLVVLGHDHKKIKRLDHFIYKNTPFRKSAAHLLYASKRFAIGYKPWARELEENLRKYAEYIYRKSSR